MGDRYCSHHVKVLVKSKENYKKIPEGISNIHSEATSRICCCLFYKLNITIIHSLHFFLAIKYRYYVFLKAY